MRRFVAVSHTGRADGDWPLNDLSAAAGRVDVLCRNVQAALFLSHGLRADVEVYLVFAQPQPRTVRIEGARIQRLHPDERSTAARIQQALKAGWPVPDWKEVQPGLSIAAYGLEELLDELAGKGTLVLLDPDGQAIEATQWPSDPVLLVSDHLPFTAEEYRVLESRHAQRVSLGPEWYHGNLAIAVAQWAMDRQAQPQAGRQPTRPMQAHRPGP